MSIGRFECQKCGNCCRNTTIPIYHSDVLRWETERRWDILSHISFAEWQDTGGFVFSDTIPKDGVCPFLSEQNLCIIHDTKPKCCRYFPLTGTLDKISQCKGIGKGKRVRPKEIQVRDRDEQYDQTETMNRSREIFALLFTVRSLNMMLKEGHIIYNESIGKYELTRSGEECLQKEYEKLQREAKVSGKTMEQIVTDKFLRFMSPQEYKPKKV